MNEWDYFLSGLMRALSWKDGQDNALIGGEPSLDFIYRTWYSLFGYYRIFGTYLIWILQKQGSSRFMEGGFQKLLGLSI